MLSRVLQVDVLAKSVAGTFPAIAKLSKLDADDLASEEYPEPLINGFAQQRAVPRPIPGKFALQKCCDLRGDARFHVRCFTVAKSPDPELLEAVAVVVNGLRVASEARDQLRYPQPAWLSRMMLARNRTLAFSSGLRSSSRKASP